MHVTTDTVERPAAVLTVNWIAVFVVAVLAIAVIYVMGLETMPYVHDSFHDLRHSAGFPCH